MLPKEFRSLNQAMGSLFQVTSGMYIHLNHVPRRHRRMLGAEFPANLSLGYIRSFLYREYRD